MVLAGPCGMTPTGPLHVAPPPVMIVERNRFRRRREDDRTGDEVLRRCAGKLRRGGCALGDRDIARGLDEARELVVGHFEIDPSRTRRHKPDESAGRRSWRQGRRAVARAGLRSPSRTRRPESRPCPPERDRGPRDRRAGSARTRLPVFQRPRRAGAASRFGDGLDAAPWRKRASALTTTRPTCQSQVRRWVSSTAPRSTERLFCASMRGIQLESACDEHLEMQAQSTVTAAGSRPQVISAGRRLA